MWQLQRETSERSQNRNWVRKKLLDAGFILESFEGYTIKENSVSLLLDRARLTNPVDDPGQGYASVSSFLSGPSIRRKTDFARRMGVPYYFAAYSFDESSSRATDIYVLDMSKKKIIRKFTDSYSFSKWLGKFRDLIMHSKYEEDGLPGFDVELRRLGSPWPGNLDGILYCPNNQQPMALIEFQTTIIVPVRKHCNNKYFLPTEERKGDEQRWKVLDIIRLQANLPLLILVWSPDNLKEVKLKVVKRIVYSNEKTAGVVPGLKYSYKKVLQSPKLINTLLRTCQRAQYDR